MKLCYILLIISLLLSCSSHQKQNTDTKQQITQSDPVSGEQVSINEEIKPVAPPDLEAEQKADAEKDIIKNYEELTSSVILTPSILPPPSVKGSTFKKPFSIVVTYTDNSPAADLPVTIEYPQSIQNDTIEFTKISVLTDEKGLIAFESPQTTFSCNSFISFYPSPDSYNTEIDSIIQRSALKVPYVVKTNLASAGGSICLLDYDKQGRPITNNGLSSSAVLGSLIRSGFSRIGNSEFYTEIDSGDYNMLYNSAKSLFGSMVSYLIAGTVKYAEEPVKNDDGFIVTLTADIICIDMNTNTVLYKTSVQTSAAGKTEQSALNSARSEQLAPLLAEKIIYGM